MHVLSSTCVADHLFNPAPKYPDCFLARDVLNKRGTVIECVFWISKSTRGPLGDPKTAATGKGNKYISYNSITPTENKRTWSNDICIDISCFIRFNDRNIHVSVNN